MYKLRKTEKGAGLIVGGIPNETTHETEYGIYIPNMLSFLAYGNFTAEVKGLNDFPKANWPPIAVTHLPFQAMVGLGVAMALIGIIFAFLWFRKKEYLFNRKFLLLVALATPFGFLAVEAGWMVTEVGRQPWILYNILRTSDAVSPVPGQVFHLIIFSFTYILLSFAAFWLMKRQIQALEHSEQGGKQ